MNWRKWFASAALTCAALLFVEVFLRLFGFGHSTSFFRQEPGGTVSINHHFGRLFYPPELVRGAYPSRFSARKLDGTVRIFVFGESAAAGFPDPCFSFSRILQVMLEQACPDRRFEVINTGVTAMDSHAIRLIAAESARFEPDAVVIYAGNNEFVGPNGPASVLGGGAAPWPMVRFVTWLRSTRVGQLLQSGIDGLLRTSRPEQWDGMGMFRNASVAADDASVPRVYANFEKNLRDTVSTFTSRGIPMVLATVASNTADFAPFVSGTGQSAQAVYDEGIAARKGGRLDDALELFSRARDLDILRFRSDSRINDIIRNVGRENGVALVDAEKIFSQKQISAPPGEPPLFFEHVHLTFDGNALLADLCARGLAEVLGARMGCLRSLSSAPAPETSSLAARLGYTPLAEGYSIGTIRDMLGKAPFANRPGNSEQNKLLGDRLVAIEGKLTPPDVQELIARLRDITSAHPDDACLAFWLARHYEDQNQFAEAESEYRRSLELLPGNPASLAQLGDLLHLQGRHTEAAAAYEQFLAIIPSHAGYRRKLIEAKMSD